MPKEVAQATAEAVPYIDTQPKPAAASSGDVPGRVYEADYLEIYSIGGSVKVRWWNKKVSKKVEQNSFQEGVPLTDLLWILLLFLSFLLLLEPLIHHPLLLLLVDESLLRICWPCS